MHLGVLTGFPKARGKHKPRPGLPPLLLGRAVLRRQQRILLVFCYERRLWRVFGFPCGGFQFRQRTQSRPRFSVALPLGINGRTASFTGRGYSKAASTLWVGRPGETAMLDAGAACCGPPVGRRPARAVLRTARARPNSRPRVRLTAAPLSLRRLFPRAGEILLEQFVIVLTISYSSGRARLSFVRAPGRFILFRLIAETVESPPKAWRAVKL